MNSLVSLFTRRNLEILAAISAHEHSLRELAEALRISPGKVHQAITLFEEAGIITVRDSKNRRVLGPNRSSPLYQKIMALLNTHRILSAPSFAQLTKFGVVGLYGSFAQGTDDAGSDIDLLLVTEKKDRETRPVFRALETELGRRISPLVITSEKLRRLAQEDPEFGVRLKSTIVALHGDPFG